ncbi:hypothetical protein AD428_23740 [Achromobacter sp. DMS1]|nr:hypothetical protein AD428_23740 [Achromobacter sp. DMS1]
MTMPRTRRPAPLRRAWIRSRPGRGRPGGGPGRRRRTRWWPTWKSSPPPPTPLARPRIAALLPSRHWAVAARRAGCRAGRR